jgi:hypothetical protein
MGAVEFTPNENSGTWSWSFTTTDGTEDEDSTPSQFVTITATDSSGATDEVKFGLVVVNLPPSVDIDGPTTGLPGETIFLDVDASDPIGPADSTNGKGSWDYDFTITQAGVGMIGYGTVEDVDNLDDFAFTPSTPGTFTFTFSVRDKDGALGTRSITITVLPLTTPTPPTPTPGIVDLHTIIYTLQTTPSINLLGGTSSLDIINRNGLPGVPGGPGSVISSFIGGEYLSGVRDALASISGLVYVDANGNGLADGGEQGIPNAAVTLYGNEGNGNRIVGTVKTDAEGNYSFTYLRAGSFTISMAEPGGYLPGAEMVGMVNGKQIGKATEKGVIESIVLASTDQGISYNFGELLPASVSGVVYQDSNRSGMREGGEPGIGGVQVTLTGMNDKGKEVKRTVETDPDGSYTFVDLRPGEYAVTVGKKDALMDGVANAGSVGGKAKGATEIAEITISSGTKGVQYNFGKVTGRQPQGRGLGLDADILADSAAEERAWQEAMNVYFTEDDFLQMAGESDTGHSAGELALASLALLAGALCREDSTVRTGPGRRRGARIDQAS